ncbi:related to Putative lipoate-protein ligase A [Saccharomycodes ludwigii]|uniref:Putative lipoate-protein ligase A n=1 Tax=Saccharomycodes ludwigii TaxID=36035 RepID=A0A376B8X8_9ASCO|nr:hypothetical protein SCDLUD_003531 [Saccharomycodes ludwigii]KAH3900543.1 hypothetical protein SCDLUD_003531 [Saccharomycodes ludwigii]SSD61029.1 related to Putative lipoate-protein ligase A [Saccharomycodes ludwigii]
MFCNSITTVTNKILVNQFVKLPHLNLSSIKTRNIYNGSPNQDFLSFVEKDEDTTKNDGRDKYEDFNNMYVNLFTATSHQNEHISTTNSTKVNNTSSINLLNKELLDVFECPDDNNLNQNNGVPLNNTTLTGAELSTIVRSNGKFVLISKSHDPYYNLSLEDYVFNNTPSPQPLIKTKNPGVAYENQRLMFYINDECCVIGKNQNPWKELYLGNLKHRGLPFLRRKSGGGAVVHDLGNVNYSFLNSREQFDKLFFNKLITDTLNKHILSNTILDPHQKKQEPFFLRLNERGDIIIGEKDSPFKVSGSAFKIAKNKSYHHGTMLINSDLPRFKNLLKPAHVEGYKWDCNAVESVRSQIANLRDYNVLKSTSEFIDMVTKSFQLLYGKVNVPVYYCGKESTMNDEISKTMKELQNEEWKFDKTPKFKFSINKKKTGEKNWVEVKNGIIENSDDASKIGLHFNELYIK